jgi:hypothetical protein
MHITNFLNTSFIYYNFLFVKVFKSNNNKKNLLLETYKINLNLNKYSQELFRYNFVIIKYYGFSKLLKLEHFNIFYEVYKLKSSIKRILHVYRIWRIRNPHDDEIIYEEFVDFYDQQSIKYEKKFVKCDIWFNYQVELYFFKPYILKLSLLQDYDNILLINFVINDLLKDYLILIFSINLNNINWYINYCVSYYFEVYISTKRFFMFNSSCILVNYFIQSFFFLNYFKVFNIFKKSIIFKNFNKLNYIKYFELKKLNILLNLNIKNIIILEFTGCFFVQEYAFYNALLRAPGKGFWYYRSKKKKHLRLI